jgi:hypothetical protein
MTDIENIIEGVWRDHVASRHVYRGMSRRDLSDPIDPADNPHADALPLVRKCLDVLQRVVDSGFEFTLVETHWDQSWRHDLRNIVAWSRNDLNHPRIDFISTLQTAREYSDNWQGSQLKQNLKYITEHLPEHKHHPVLRQALSDPDWSLLERAGHWVNNGHAAHIGIVLWLRRSHPGLRSKSKCAPIGTKPDFRGRILEELEHKGLPHDAASVTGLLPKEFDAYLIEPLWHKDIDRIEETAEPSVRGDGKPAPQP